MSNRQGNCTSEASACNYVAYYKFKVLVLVGCFGNNCMSEASVITLPITNTIFPLFKVLVLVG